MIISKLIECQKEYEHRNSSSEHRKETLIHKTRKYIKNQQSRRKENVPLEKRRACKAPQKPTT
jgi:hypothetical protein